MLRFALGNPIALLVYLAVVTVAITLHEFAHAWTADRLGDPTPRQEGRLSLNPLAHLDPVGALMLFLFGFGWARPVPINPWHFRDSRRGMLMVALAGPLANVVMAWVANLIWSAIRLSPGWAGVMVGPLPLLLNVSIQLNLWLAAFNLIPVPPLDGSRILAGLLPRDQAVALARMESYGPLLLVLLIVSGVSSLILEPIYRLLALLVRGFS